MLGMYNEDGTSVIEASNRPTLRTFLSAHLWDV
jgi:hypothetical protein